MSISIVMTYHNRREQLLRTIASIRYFGNPEIIVVDDASDEDQRIDDVLGITLIRIEKKDKTWINTCIPYNKGFAHAHGDIVIIQNAECLHTGDILSYCEKLTKGNMYSFGAYSLDEDLTGNISTTVLKEMILKEPQRGPITHHGWYNHSKHRPCSFHFCNAIMRSDLENIGGFDERYAPGLAYEDNEILERIKRADIKITIVDDPFVIHQKHARTDYQTGKEAYALNRALYENVTLKESIVKAPNNSYYGWFRDISTTTHLPLVGAALEVFKPKFILELGIGYYSTGIFNSYIKEFPSCGYLGVENDISWIKQLKSSYPELFFAYHDLGSVSTFMPLSSLSPYRKDLIIDYYKSIALPTVCPRLLFVDNYGSCRAMSINALRDRFDLIIMHDCEPVGVYFHGYDKINTEGFTMYYLKTNLSWTMLMVRSGMENASIYEIIKTYTTNHMANFPAIEWMTLTPNYL